ncbi:hypothetical protein HZH66_002818 [Vespula vulgaris]|uniref:Uncharacterized protein n=1 Tax=Vespula vulgaris TaxID=7454 RepID=A0A834KM08_VESVU|nr:hypothetical protein HZH66_002818 [Vespula vulgaris]
MDHTNERKERKRDAAIIEEDRRSEKCYVFTRSEEVGVAVSSRETKKWEMLVTALGSVPSTSHVEHEHATEPRTAEEPSLLRVAAAVIAYN